AWALWWLWWFRNRPQDHPHVNEAELAVIAEGRSTHEVLVSGGAPPAGARPGPLRGPVPWGMIFLGLAPVMLYAQQFFRAGANRFCDHGMPTYLQDAFRLDKARSAMLASLPQWVMVVGGLVGGVVSDAVLLRTGSRRAGRKLVALVSLLAAVGCYLLAW